MKAAVLVESGKVEIREVPAPSPRKGEALIKVKEAGICGSDFALFSGKIITKFPFFPGHEAVGEVAALGPGAQGLTVGERVTIQPNFSCGECPPCLKGKENICVNKIRLGLDVDGVFAQYVAAPHSYVWPLPENLSYSTGALIEPLAVALHGYNKSRPDPGEKVLIYGAGIIGLLFLQLALLSKGKVTAFDIAEPRLAIAMKLGAQQTARSLSDLEKEAGSFSLIYEISGIPEALSHIIHLCAPGARVVLTGLPEHEFPVLTTPVVRKEITIHGSMIYQDEFPAAINLLKRGEINVQALISDAYPLEKLQQALENFRSPNRVKTLIQIP